MYNLAIFGVFLSQTMHADSVFTYMFLRKFFVANPNDPLVGIIVQVDDP